MTAPPLAAPAGGRVRRGWVAAFLGTFLLLFAVGHGNIENTDVTATMHAARALLLRGDSGLRGAEQEPEWPGEAFLAGFIRLRWDEGKPTYGKDGADGLVYVWFPIGHLWLMVPPVALGEGLARLFPGAEARFRERVAPGVPDAQLLANLSYRDGHFVFDQALCATLPALFGAASILLLFGIARALGASARDALWSTLAIALGTQFFPLARENLSDGPGLCFLLGALWFTVRAVRGDAAARTLLLGGLLAGCAVLSRYQHAALVPLLLLAVALAAGRAAARLRRVLWFALGGLPCLLLLLLVNWLRFHDVTDTGYPQAGSWFNYPVWFGATKILFAAGKGILWFSPLLWLAVPLALRRPRPSLAWLGFGLFLVPLLLFSTTSGWQSGQCWGVRYVTPGIVGLLAIALPQLAPWRTHRRTFLALLALGVAVNVTGVVTPSRGYGQLAGQAVEAYYQREHREGRISVGDWENLDAADHYFFEPRYSPLHANWTYLLRSVGGRFEDERGRPQNDSANTIGPLFGVEAVTPEQETAPVYWEDRAGRHLWWTFWGALLGVPSWLLLLPVLAGGIALARRGWRRVLRQP